MYDTRQQHIDFLRNTLGTTNWSSLYDCGSIDSLYNSFLDIIRNSIALCIPSRTVSLRQSEPYYITPLIKSLLCKRNRLRRKGKLEEAGELAAKINRMITEIQQSHLRNLTTASPSELWQAVRENSGKNNHTDGPAKTLPRNPDTVNTFFARISQTASYDLQDILDKRKHITSDETIEPIPEYIIEQMLSHMKSTSPGIDDIPSWFFKKCSVEIAEIIAYIINKTIETGEIPDNWKIAVVTPVQKVQNPKSLLDYRPISVTPILSRIAEKLIVSHYLKPAMSTVNLENQYAYKPTGSTNCALIHALDFITSSLDRPGNHFVEAIAIDFSKAFDTVDHMILLNKIGHLELPHSIYNWVISFLTKRRQIVKVNGVKSRIEPINLGIVQGSVLGPFLFIVMMADLLPLSPSNCIIKYADDTTYLIPEDSEVPAQLEYDNAKNYAVTNKLTINIKKNKYLLFCRPRVRISNPPTFNEIGLVSQFKLLGVILDNKLSFQQHLSFVLSTCSQRFYLLKLLREQGMPLPCLHNVYVSIVVNRITYCLSAWGGDVKQHDINRINSVFRKAKKYRFTDTIYDFEGLLRYHDENLFLKMGYSNHCLHHLLQTHKEKVKDLRNRGHDYSLPLCNSNMRKNSFIPRTLYSFIN